MIKEPYEPRMIKDIWKYLQQTVGNPLYYRIRNTETLEDILVIAHKSWVQALPKNTQCLKCDELTFNRYELNCDEPLWALLSTSTEVKNFGYMTWKEVANTVKNNYRPLSFVKKVENFIEKAGNPYGYVHFDEKSSGTRLKEIEKYHHSF